MFRQAFSESSIHHPGPVSDHIRRQFPVCDIRLTHKINEFIAKFATGQDTFLIPQGHQKLNLILEWHFPRSFIAFLIIN